MQAVRAYAKELHWRVQSSRNILMLCFEEISLLGGIESQKHDALTTKPKHGSVSFTAIEPRLPCKQGRPPTASVSFVGFLPHEYGCTKDRSPGGTAGDVWLGGSYYVNNVGFV